MGWYMSEKASVTLSGKVQKVIEPVFGEPEKAEITIEGADPLYAEIRIENSLENSAGEEVRLKKNDEVDVIVEADDSNTPPEDTKTLKAKRHTA